jgi:hypothetical protein
VHVCSGSATKARQAPASTTATWSGNGERRLGPAMGNGGEDDGRSTATPCRLVPTQREVRRAEPSGDQEREEVAA